MKIVRNILAVIVGLAVGMFVNMGLVMIGPTVIPVPEGVDITTPEGLKAGMPLMQPKHFIFPFLAHALGTFAGALVAALIAATKKRTFAFVIGILFLIGGVANIFMLPSPVWFTLLDLIVAYIPMAWLAGKLGPKNKTPKAV